MGHLLGVPRKALPLPFPSLTSSPKPDPRLARKPIGGGHAPKTAKIAPLSTILAFFGPRMKNETDTLSSLFDPQAGRPGTQLSPPSPPLGTRHRRGPLQAGISLPWGLNRQRSPAHLLWNSPVVSVHSRYSGSRVGCREISVPIPSPLLLTPPPPPAPAAYPPP